MTSRIKKFNCNYFPRNRDLHCIAVSSGFVTEKEQDINEVIDNKILCIKGNHYSLSKPKTSRIKVN